MTEHKNRQTTESDSPNYYANNDGRKVQIRDEVLRKIGRNTVRFQKMEAMLKKICLICSDMDPEKFPDRRTMGQVVKPLVERTNRTAERQMPADRPIMRIVMTLHESLGNENSRQRALRRVIHERNQLIDQWLVAFDPESMASCERLGERLDAQWARTQHECELLVSISRGLQEFLFGFQTFFRSGQFDEDLRHALVR